jgi:hypothetical protein
MNVRAGARLVLQLAACVLELLGEGIDAGQEHGALFFATLPLSLHQAEAVLHRLGRRNGEAESEVVQFFVLIGNERGAWWWRGGGDTSCLIL